MQIGLETRAFLGRIVCQESYCMAITCEVDKLNYGTS